MMNDTTILRSMETKPEQQMETTSAWRIERNHKMHFRVVRDTPEGKEVLRSASGRDSSFRTYRGALRACAPLNVERKTS